jgi:hypothetical protein
MMRPEPREGSGRIDDAGERLFPDCDIRWVQVAPTSTQWLAWRRLWEKLLQGPLPEMRQHEGSHDEP